VPLENLALSTQCGFASTEEGNKLTQAQQWDKLDFVIQTANKIWG
jgi:methionine synthase II (cobalamin-independent)